jgi:hypothetical protein
MFHTFGTNCTICSIKPKGALKGVTIVCFHRNHICKYMNCILYISWFDYFVGKFAQKTHGKWKKIKIYRLKISMWDANEIKQTNNIILERTTCPFAQRLLFHIWMNFWTFFSQIVIINAYNCPNTWHFFCL